MTNKILTALTSAFIMAASVAASQPEEGYPSPAGNVRVVGESYEKTLYVGETKFDLGSQHLISVREPSEEGFSEHFPNHFLIWEWGGGSMCHGFFRWLNANETPPKLTESFGTCKDVANNLRVEDGKAIFELYGAGSEGRVSFIYDGEQVTERNAGLDGISKVANPYDPEAWIGEHPWIYFAAPENEAFLTDLLGWELLDQLRFYGVGSEFTEDEGWVVGRLCQQSQCNTNKLVVAISKSTAMPYIAYKHWKHEEWRFIGDAPEKMPNSVRGYLAEG
ncbi:hypothetical protein K3759_11125 [Sulfitobacter sp. W027]|uniref:hypothetical protein n=1 Tax=Sulfitobacter sp. W027 TaxID=2867025 RepID=UPI0021A79CA0|nr:hypothetical protein [Sulfitobacter sp. W027]UWR32509.1 hypothetical protein K3759_11125 [Sulfitobacter sp. W027]